MKTELKKKMENGIKEETGVTNELETEIGTIENSALEPKRVKIMTVELSEIEKNGKVVGKKVTCMSKHPDKDEVIAISTVKFVKANIVKSSGLWVNTDDDKKIQKGSALALLMNKADVKTPKELEGKELDTELDERGYLCFKAY